MCSTHAAEACGDDQASLQAASEVLVGAGGEGLVGSLHNALASDVDPGSCGHLSVHGESHSFESAELIKSRPSWHEVAIGEKHPWGLVVGAEHTDRLARLDEQGFVVLKAFEGTHDSIVTGGVAHGLAGTAIYHEILWTLGHIGV